MKKVLITGDLFVGPEHERQLEDAGFAVTRLDAPQATEAELVNAIRGKAGYILGGIEHVTEPVIDAADRLEAIVFTGTGYRNFIPAWEYATKKGVAIANVPNGHTHAVAEWALAAALAMNRGFFTLGRNNGQVFQTTPGIEGRTVGVIGLGHIGRRIAEMVQANQPREVLYHSAHRHQDAEAQLGIAYAELLDLLERADIVFLCVAHAAGPNFLGRDQLMRMRPDSLLVSIVQPGVINADALLDCLRAGRLRAVSDYPMDDRFDALPLERWFSFRESNAFNAQEGVRFTSGKAVHSLINLLTEGNDADLVNPDHRKYREERP